MRSFLPFLLALFVLAAILRADFAFVAAYLLFAVYLLSRLWLGRMAKNLRVRRRFTPRAFYGDDVKVEVWIENAGRLPIPWLAVHESLSVELTTPPFRRQVFSLGPRERRPFGYDLHCRKRGYYPIGPLTASTGDLLGIEERDLGQFAPDYLIVYPRTVPLERLGLPTRSPLVALSARAPLFEDPSRVVGVRDYQRGDSPRRIHWTATASAGRLLVKQYQPSIARETLVCLDLNEESYDLRHRFDAAELAIVIAASVARHIAVRERLPAGLATEALDARSGKRARFFLPPRRERAQLMNLLEVLARAQLTPATPFPELLRRESVRLSWGTTLAAITGRVSEDLFDTLAYLRRTGFAIALILVQPGSLSAELQKRASLLGMPIHRLWRERDLEQWQ
jgi:uncharacterized protein (DUF58 family)